MLFENPSWAVWVETPTSPKILASGEITHASGERQRTENLTHLLSCLLFVALGYVFAACWAKPWQVQGLFHAFPRLSVRPGLGRNSPLPPPGVLQSLFSELWFQRSVWYKRFTSWRGGLAWTTLWVQQREFGSSQCWLILCQMWMEGMFLHESLHKLCLIRALDKAPPLNDCHHWWIEFLDFPKIPVFNVLLHSEYSYRCVLENLRSQFFLL